MDPPGCLDTHLSAHLLRACHCGSLVPAFPLWQGVLDLQLKRAGGHPEHIEAHHEEGEPGGFCRVINTRVVLSGLLCFCGTLVFGVMEPSLAEHLTSKAGISQTAVGGVFAGAPIPPQPATPSLAFAVDHTSSWKETRARVKRKLSEEGNRH